MNEIRLVTYPILYEPIIPNPRHLVKNFFRVIKNKSGTLARSFDQCKQAFLCKFIMIKNKRRILYENSISFELVSFVIFNLYYNI